MKTALTVMMVLVVAHILMLSSMRILPMNDLPFHLAVSTIHRYYDSPSNYFSEYYDVDIFPGPNCFHPLFCGLSIFPGVEAGNRVYYALYLVLLPLSVLLVARRAGGSAWLALLSLLLLYNMSFRWGFTGYTMAIPFTVLALYFHLMSLRRGGAGLRIVVAIALAALYFMHAMAGLYCGLLFGLSVILHHRRSPGAAVRELLPAAPLVGLVIWWLAGNSVGQGNAFAGFLEYYRSEYLATLAGRAGLLHNDHSHILTGSSGKTVGTLISLCIVGPLVAAVMLRRRSLRHSLEKPEARSILLFLLVTLACYLLLPKRGAEVYFIYRRMSIFVLIWSVALLSVVCSGRLRKPAVAAVCIVCVVYAVLWGSYFRAFEHENEVFVREFLPQDSREATLIGLIQSNDFRGAPVYSNFGDYHVVWNLGITKGMYAQFKYIGVWPKRPEEWPHPRWAGRPTTRERLRPYSTSDFVLLRGMPGPQSDIYLRGFQLMRSAGEWHLYEKGAIADSPIPSP